MMLDGTVMPWYSLMVIVCYAFIEKKTHHKTSGGGLEGSFFFFFFLNLFIIICKYTVAVFRHTRRGSQILLKVVVSHHVVAGIWTLDLRKSSRVLLPAEPSHQPPVWQVLVASGDSG
jgi:hypothetical protein